MNPTGPPEFDAPQIAEILRRFGCPEEKCKEMSELLLKRASQLAAQRGQHPSETLMGLLSLMRQGWSARERGFSTDEMSPNA